jgi:hypothetical protein
MGIVNSPNLASSEIETSVSEITNELSTISLQWVEIIKFVKV